MLRTQKSLLDREISLADSILLLCTEIDDLVAFPRLTICVSNLYPLASRLDFLIHLEFDYQAGNMERVSLKTWRQLKNGLTLVRTVV
jgi:hypothetical protein